MVRRETKKNQKMTSGQNHTQAPKLSFRALLRNLMVKFICCVNLSQNNIVTSLINLSYSAIPYQLPMWRYWYDTSFVRILFVFTLEM